MIWLRLKHTVTIPMYHDELAVRALREENSELKVRLAESEAMLQAIRSGAVDAIVVDTSAGEQFFMLNGAETPYREMVETMSEGAVTVGSDGVILYSNQRFADMLRTDLRSVIGSDLLTYYTGQDATAISAAFQQSATTVPRLRAMLVAADATQVSMNIAMHAHPTYGTNSIAIVITDLTKWQEAENARERTLRALRMMKACADVIMYSTDEVGMLTGVCRVMVSVGGYKSACVGLAGEVAAASFCSRARSAGNRDDMQNPGSVLAEPTPGGGPVGVRGGFVVHDEEIPPHWGDAGLRGTRR
jgi:PAS domain S-box-containing protein